jgi:plastocyanin
MYDTLDSRLLRPTDCYAQRFMRPGTYRYAVVPMYGEAVTEVRPFSVLVSEGARSGDDRMQQHNVVVRSDGKRLVAQPADLEIGVGDLVLWNCQDRGALPYLVAGDKEFFSSHRLVNDSGYSHAFGVAGEYRWTDAFGSGTSGVVRVTNPTCRTSAEFARWRETLSKGTVVTIADDRAAPADVEIVTGQTVFFAVTKSRGISITDERLLGPRQPSAPAPAPKPRKAKT